MQKTSTLLLAVVGLCAPMNAQVPGKPNPAGAAPAAAAPAGIVLSRDWAGAVTMGAGGQAAKMDDLRFLLSDYGTPEADVAPHPNVVVYDGPPMDPSLGDNCRITYLMPLDQAEKLLMKDKGMASHAKAVAAGFPDGLQVHTYDIKFGHYNRLTIVTDSARPMPQVVSMQFKNERENWHPLFFKKIVRDWHTYDYINARNRAQPKINITQRVNDQRAKQHNIVINMAFGESPKDGKDWLQIAYRPSETSTWYLPEPMIKLILFSLSKQLGK